ncbi:MAG TPA: hypothetical protein VLJ37_01330, partial [bacterium]|nr:hypothetical protein [bacterium]
MKRILTILFLVTSIPAGASEGQVLKMKVDHLACLRCADKFKEELSSLCKDLTLDIQSGEAVCLYEDPVTPKQILKKANKTGL